MPVSLANKVGICCNAVVFITTLLMALLGDESKLFPKKINAVSRRYPTDLKVSPSTFRIWNAIYTFQCAWILYTLTLVFRKDAIEIIPTRCYVLYSFARICSTVWRLVISRDLSTLAPFLLLLTAATSLNICLLFVLKGANNESLDRIANNRFDVWCTRVFVPNAIVFYSMWQDIATSLSFNKVSEYISIIIAMINITYNDYGIHKQHNNHFIIIINRIININHYYHHQPSSSSIIFAIQCHTTYIANHNSSYGITNDFSQ